MRLLEAGGYFGGDGAPGEEWDGGVGRKLGLLNGAREGLVTVNEGSGDMGDVSLVLLVSLGIILISSAVADMAFVRGHLCEVRLLQLLFHKSDPPSPRLGKYGSSPARLYQFSNLTFERGESARRKFNLFFPDFFLQY